MNGRQLIKNILKFCLPAAISAIIGVAVLPVLSRVYPEAEYGYISNFYSIGNLLMGVLLLGLDSAYMRFFNEPPAGSTRNRLMAFSLCTGLCVNILLTALAFLIAPKWLSGLLFNDTRACGLLLLGVYTAALIVFRMLNINVRLAENAKLYNIQQVAFILGNRLLFVAAALFSTRYIYSVMVMTGAMLLLAFACAWIQRDALSEGARISPEARSEMLRYAIPFMPAAIVGFFNSSAAKLILGGFGMRNEVGVLAIATSVANIFSVIPSAFCTYWAAFMYKNYDTEQTMIKRTHDAIMLLSLIIVIAVVALQGVLYLILGAAYRGSQSYFLLIMLSPITLLLSETTGYGLNLAKKTRYILYISILACVVNVAACYILVPRIGVVGAAAGVAMAASISFLVRTLLAQRDYRSIHSGARTLAGCLLLWGLCVGNLYLYAHALLRSFICLGALCAVVVLYKDTIAVLWCGALQWARAFRERKDG